MPYDMLASDDVIQKTTAALRANGFAVAIAEHEAAAKEQALALIPEGAEVMDMTSVTLETTGIAKAIRESGRFQPVREKFAAMDPKTQGLEMRRLGATPDWAIGSAHAVTEDGQVLIASNTGSQLPAYAYGAAHVIWVVGAQKIVADTEEGIKRIYAYTLPLESERARKAYGVPGSFVSKLLIVNKEIQPGRATVILVKEKLGF